MNIEIKVNINRPAREIFTYLSNQSNHKDMISANVDSRQVSPGPMGVGTIVRNKAKFMGIKMTEEFVITEFIPDKILAKTSAPGSTFITSDRFTLEETAGETSLMLHVWADLKGFMKLLDGFFEKQVHKSLEADMIRLKENFDSGKL